MFGAKTIAMLRAFILFRRSSWTTSAIRLIAQSKREASVWGSWLTSSAQSSSVWHCITCSGDKESRTPLGSSLNQAFKSTRISKSNYQCSTYTYTSDHTKTEIMVFPNMYHVSLLYYTLISPAKQCISTSSGTNPLFNWSLTFSSWVLSALILKIPSACKGKFNCLTEKEQT